MLACSESTKVIEKQACRPSYVDKEKYQNNLSNSDKLKIFGTINQNGSIDPNLNISTKTKKFDQASTQVDVSIFFDDNFESSNSHNLRIH